MNNKKIVEVPYGLGSSYDDLIEINKDLKGKLREKIIEHELRHSSGEYSKSDKTNDFHSKNPYFFESFMFCLWHPEGFINFFPFMYSYYQKIWTYNSSALYPFLYFGIIFMVFFLVIFKANLWHILIGYLCIFATLQILCIIYVHFYVKGRTINIK
jgi:hypothetical protein